MSDSSEADKNASEKILESEKRVVQENYPEAAIKNRASSEQVARGVFSKLWLLTLACAVVAIGLVCWQWGGRGPEIEVFFAEGYGLEMGDSVRYRGIIVGEVREIALQGSLEEVSVRIQLTEAAADLAREGTRFWIERPNISIGKVRGLDTLMGGRFVGVLPGPEDAPSCHDFYGLEIASEPVSNIIEGLEVTLESKARYGLQTGSPINYRGVTVGQILSVGLTNDAATVEARAFIQSEYRGLIREGTQFWSSSGLGVKIGFSGIQLDADTLATIAAGGVSFATPDPPGKLATTGQRFELHKSPENEWIEWQPRVAIGNTKLPQGVVTPQPVLGIRNQAGAVGALGAGRRRGWLLPLSDGRLIGPSNVLTGKEDKTYRLEVAGQESDLPLAEMNKQGLLVSGKIPQAILAPKGAWPVAQVRQPKQPEEVVITCGSADTTLPIPVQRLTAVAGGWVVEPSVPLDASWHGASVVAASDGFVVGILYRNDERALVVPLSSTLLLAK